MNKNKPITIIIATICLALLSVVLVIVLKNTNTAQTNSFPVSKYMESPTSLAGNTYSTNVKIASQLAYNDEAGRIILVRTLDSDSAIPVLAPNTLSNFNPLVGQKYGFDLKIDQRGKLILTSFRKM